MSSDHPCWAKLLTKHCKETKLCLPRKKKTTGWISFARGAACEGKHRRAPKPSSPQDPDHVRQTHWIPMVDSHSVLQTKVKILWSLPMYCWGEILLEPVSGDQLNLWVSIFVVKYLIPFQSHCLLPSSNSASNSWDRAPWRMCWLQLLWSDFSLGV